jgi:hypothetical protein
MGCFLFLTISLRADAITSLRLSKQEGVARHASHYCE